jgi:L-xylulose reductase
MKLPSNFQFDFRQRRVLVTGAGKGIGREIAVMLHRFSARVVALSRTESDLENLKGEIGCETILAEPGDPDEARRAAEQAGDIDLLVNDPAIAILEPFLETWDKTMAVNLRAIMIVSQVIAKRMIERGVASSIVNVSSMASFQALHDHAAYCASKAGLDQLTAVMAVELEKPRHPRECGQSDGCSDGNGKARLERSCQRWPELGSAGLLVRWVSIAVAA